MEIDIDFPTLRAVRDDEYARARADIAELGVLDAYRRSLKRLDERLAKAPDAATLACRAGCAWCCHFSVDVRAVEAFNMLAALAALPESEQARVKTELAINRDALKELDEVQRSQRNIKCAFLANGRCVVYAARPQTCRSYHATNAAGCERSYREPNNLDIDPEFAPLTYQIGGAHVDAFAKAMDDAGFDTQAYELSAALCEAQEDRAVGQRFERREKPFRLALGSEVPLEFFDLDAE